MSEQARAGARFTLMEDRATHPQLSLEPYHINPRQDLPFLAETNRHGYSSVQ